MENTTANEQKASLQADESSNAASVGNAATGPAAPRSPSRRKISEDLENTPSPHKAGVQRHIVVPKPMKL
eukprot:g7746.t1